jgi:DNA-directed RNA polymerase subunit beta
MERPKKYFAAYKKPLVEMPNFVEPQLTSYAWLLKDGLKEVFKEFKSVSDYSGKKFDLEFTGFELEAPKHDEQYAKINKTSYEATLKGRVKLINKILGTDKEQEIFLADFPLMTDHGTFIIAGIERVMVPQLARSFGVFFTVEELRGKRLFGAKIIPSRGAWIEIETDLDGSMFVRIEGFALNNSNHFIYFSDLKAHLKSLRVLLFNRLYFPTMIIKCFFSQ